MVKQKEMIQLLHNNKIIKEIPVYDFLRTSDLYDMKQIDLSKYDIKSVRYFGNFLMMMNGYEHASGDRKKKIQENLTNLFIRSKDALTICELAEIYRIASISRLCNNTLPKIIAQDPSSFNNPILTFPLTKKTIEHLKKKFKYKFLQIQDYSAKYQLPAPISDVEISPNADYLVVATLPTIEHDIKGNAILFDIKTQKLVKQWQQENLKNIIFSDNGRYLALLGNDVIIIDLVKGATATRLPVKNVSSLSFSPNGAYIALVDTLMQNNQPTHKFMLFDIQGKKIIETSDYSPMGQHAHGAIDSTSTKYVMPTPNGIYEFDLKTSEAKNIAPGNTAHKLSFTSDNKYLIAQGTTFVSLIDLQKNKIFEPVRQLTPINQVAITHDGKYALVTSDNAAPILIDISNEKTINLALPLRQEINDAFINRQLEVAVMALSPDNTYALINFIDKRKPEEPYLYSYNLEKKSFEKVAAYKDKKIRTIKFAGNSNYFIMTFDYSDDTELVDVTTFESIVLGDLPFATLSPDQKFLIAGTEDTEEIEDNDSNMLFVKPLGLPELTNQQTLAILVLIELDKYKKTPQLKDTSWVYKELRTLPESLRKNLAKKYKVSQLYP
jgi:WD40 repeat protein